ncbi:hypothetical protein HY345_01775 [Candidatus Microgenomates bacterium]|nr:hypothetical protein [Candidatus Microgenomates bacterium]
MSIESLEIINRQTQTELLRTFLAEVNQSAVSRQINGDVFRLFLSEARDKQLPLTFVAITCPDWIKPREGNPDVDRVIGLVDKKNKRARRFAAEISNFQNALNTFGVRADIFFAVSNVELPLHLALNNMGLVIHNPETAERNIASSQINLSELITDSGGIVTSFDHMEMIKKFLKTDDLEEIQRQIAGKSNPTMREFLDGLYEFDLSFTVPSFRSPNSPGIVYLDIQSFGFIDDVLSFRIIGNRVAPTLPVLAPFNNSGDWHGAPRGETHFPTKFEIIARELQLKDVPANEQELFRLISPLPDAVLSDFLNRKGVPVIVNSRESKKDAISKVLFIFR